MKKALHKIMQLKQLSNWSGKNNKRRLKANKIKTARTKLKPKNT